MAHEAVGGASPGDLACPACGGAVTAGAKFCSQCGRTMPEAPACPACGTPLSASARFCSVCGAPSAPAAPRAGGKAPRQAPPRVRVVAEETPKNPAAPPRRGRARPEAAVSGQEPESGAPRGPAPRPTAARAAASSGKEAKRKRKPWLLLALGLVLAVCAGGVVFKSLVDRLPPDDDLSSIPQEGNAQAEQDLSGAEDTGRSDTPAEEAGISDPPAEAGADWTEVLTGTATPGEGAVLRGATGGVEIRPDAISEPAYLRVEAAWDGRMLVTLDPPQELSIPALVTLPMPPGGQAGADPSAWPVALLDPGTDGQLLLLPESIGADSFSVLVPHFSEVQAALRRKVDGQGQADQYAPNGFDYTFSVPSAGAGDTSVPAGEEGLIFVKVSARAPAGYPPTMDPPWNGFQGLRLKMYGEGTEPAADVELVNGESTDLPVPMNVRGHAPFTELLLQLEAADGTLIGSRSVAVPNRDFWAFYNCRGTFDWLDFRIQYLRDPRQNGAPDSGYISSLGSDGDVPGRVRDACSALTYAYNVFSGSGAFDDPGNAPGLPMSVRLQPWTDSYSGNPTNYLVLSTKDSPTYDVFKVEAAHELAHRFQNQYSFGYTDHWLHEASAEYLARWLHHTPDTNVGAFVCTTCDEKWIRGGLFSSEKASSYAASSFLAYLHDRHQLNIARLWVEGGSGWANFSAWETYLDAQLAPAGGLSQVWESFARAYLVDHSVWGEWGGFPEKKQPERIWSDWQNAIFLSMPGRKFDLSFAERVRTPCLSGSGIGLRYTGTPAVTIGLSLVPVRQAAPAVRAGQGLGTFTQVDRSSASAWLHPSLTVDGYGYLLAYDNGGWKTDFRLGATAGALSPSLEARLTYITPLLDDCASNYLQVEARALPLLQAKLDGHDLSWFPSPFETTTDRDGKAWFDSYEVVQEVGGQYVVLTTLPATTVSVDLSSLSEKPQVGTPVCVRIRDIEGLTGPEACPAAGLTVLIEPERSISVPLDPAGSVAADITDVDLVVVATLRDAQVLESPVVRCHLPSGCTLGIGDLDPAQLDQLVFLWTDALTQLEPLLPNAAEALGGEGEMMLFRMGYAGQPEWEQMLQARSGSVSAGFGHMELTETGGKLSMKITFTMSEGVQ